MKAKQISHTWKVIAEPNEDREGEQVYLEHSSGVIGSLECADNEGEIDGTYVPGKIIAAAFDWIESANIDY